MTSPDGETNQGGNYFPSPCNIIYHTEDTNDKAGTVAWNKLLESQQKLVT